MSSCTAALILSMLVLGIGPGDEVLVPAMTFVASANAVEHAGAKPVLIDPVPETGIIDLEAAEAAITPATRAIMPVHLAGRPVDTERLNALRDGHGLLVIEDAAHAIGAEWRGARIGTFGNVTAFSFYVTKNISTIEGGALVTEDAEVAAEVERLALHGLSLGAWQRFSDVGFRHYEVVRPGFKYNMTDVQAALVCISCRGWTSGSIAGRSCGSVTTSCCAACRCTSRRHPSRARDTLATSTRCCSTRMPRIAGTSCSTRWPSVGSEPVSITAACTCTRSTAISTASGQNTSQWPPRSLSGRRRARSHPPPQMTFTTTYSERRFSERPGSQHCSSFGGFRLESSPWRR